MAFRLFENVEPFPTGQMIRRPVSQDQRLASNSRALELARLRRLLAQRTGFRLPGARVPSLDGPIIS